MNYKDVKVLVIEKIKLLMNKKELEFDEYRIIDKDSWMSVYKYKKSKFYLYCHSVEDREDYIIGYNSILLPLDMETESELVAEIKNYISGMDISTLQKIK